MTKTKIFTFICLAATVVIWPFSQEAAAATYIFPVLGPSSFSNDFNAPRSNGPHHATDIIADKGQKIVSAVDGTVVFVGYPQPSWGYAVFIRSAGGYTYRYLHINNDTPGTDDGRGDGFHAYAPDMKVGNEVVRGQLIGNVGDSGNAEGTVPHLHFEVFHPNGSATNPYYSLRSAQRISDPVTYPALQGEILPYGNTYRGGLNVAMGNFDADPATELITGPGAGGSPRVRVYDDNDAWIGYNFFSFSSAFRGGTDVAAGDVDGDGKDEIIAGAGPGGGPKVAVFKLGAAGAVTKLAEINAFGVHKGGVKVAAGDVDGDGKDEIIAGAGPGGGPRVSVFETNGTLLKSFYPYAATFKGGVDVASADVADTALDEIITAPGKGAPSRVQVFSLGLTRFANFYAYSAGYSSGVRISAGNVWPGTAKAEILTSPDNGSSPHLRLFNSQGGNLQSIMFLEEWWRGSYDVAAGYDTSKAATGVSRRGTVRPGIE